MESNKYILSGGFMRKAKDGGASLCSCIVSDQKNITMLECMFAEDEEKWSRNLQKDKALFEQFTPDTKIEFILAQKDKFAEQIKSADVVFFKGGSPKKLLDTLSDDLSWMNAMKDKTVAATSAGVYALSSYYLDRTEVQPKVSKGLSILPIKSIVHYGSNFHQGNAISEEKNNIFWNNATVLMQNFEKEKNLQLLCIREGEYVDYSKRFSNDY